MNKSSTRLLLVARVVAVGIHISKLCMQLSYFPEASKLLGKLNILEGSAHINAIYSTFVIAILL